MRLRTLFILGCLCGVLSASNTWADGVIRDGIGPISTGRGGTNIGFADNAAIIYDNPAGMSNVAGSGLMELGMDTVICDLHYSDPDNPSVSNVKRAFPPGMFGYINRWADSPWSYGLGVVAPAGFGAEYRMLNPFTGPSLYRSLDLMGKLLPAVSYRFTDRLSVGGNLGLAINHSSLEGPFFVQTGPFAGTPALLDLHATGAAVCGGVGAQYLLTPDTTVGINYIAPTHFYMDGNARATLITPFGPLTSGFGAKTTLTWPQSLGIGLKQNLCCCQRIGLDVIWYDWSSAFDTIGLTFTNPSNPVVAGLLGSRFHDEFPLRWHDTVSLRSGYEQDINDLWTWRTGYVFHPSPVPNATLNPYTDGVLLHTFSLGLTRRVQRGALNFAYQYSFSPTRHVGASSIVGGDFSNSTFTAQSHWINLSYLLPF